MTRHIYKEGGRNVVLLNSHGIFCIFHAILYHNPFQQMETISLRETSYLPKIRKLVMTELGFRSNSINFCAFSPLASQMTIAKHVI